MYLYNFDLVFLRFGFGFLGLKFNPTNRRTTGGNDGRRLTDYGDNGRKDNQLQTSNGRLETVYSVQHTPKVQDGYYWNRKGRIVS